MIKNSIGANLRNIRIHNNLSLQTVADELHVSKQFLSDVELGKKKLPLNQLKNFCSFFNIDLQNILDLPRILLTNLPDQKKIEISCPLCKSQHKIYIELFDISQSSLTFQCPQTLDYFQVSLAEPTLVPCNFYENTLNPNKKEIKIEDSVSLRPSIIKDDGLQEKKMSENQKLNQCQSEMVDSSVSIFNKYDCIQLIGEGTQGIVYKARHQELGSEAVIKVLKNSYDKKQLDRFRKTSLIWAHLNHANISKVFAANFSDLPLQSKILMEYIRGKDIISYLNEIRKNDPFRIETYILNIFIQLFSALQYLYDNNCMHNDIKPENILVQDNIPKFVDFGLVTQSIQPQGFLGGALRYLSPEKLRSYLQPNEPIQIDIRSEIFSLGCVLFKCLTDRDAHPGTTSDEIETNILNNVPLFKETDQISDLVKRCCLKCLQKDINNRYQKPIDVVDELVGKPFPWVNASNVVNADWEDMIIVWTRARYNTDPSPTVVTLVKHIFDVLQQRQDVENIDKVKKLGKKLVEIVTIPHHVNIFRLIELGINEKFPHLFLIPEIKQDILINIPNYTSLLLAARLWNNNQLTEALEIAKNLTGSIVAQYIIAMCYRRDNCLPAAEHTLMKSLENLDKIKENIHDYYHLKCRKSLLKCNILRSLAVIYRSLGEEYQLKNQNKMNEYYRKAEETFQDALNAILTDETLQNAGNENLIPENFNPTSLVPSYDISIKEALSSFYFSYGYFLYKLENYDKAEELFNKSCELTPRWLAPFPRLGIINLIRAVQAQTIEERDNFFDKAINIFLNALGIFQDNFAKDLQEYLSCSICVLGLNILECLRDMRIFPTKAIESLQIALDLKPGIALSPCECHLHDAERIEKYINLTNNNKSIELVRTFIQKLSKHIQMMKGKKDGRDKKGG